MKGHKKISQGHRIVLVVLVGLLLPLLIASNAVAMGMGGWDPLPATLPAFDAVGNYLLPGTDLVRIDVGPEGNLYISDTHYDRVRILSNNGVELGGFGVRNPLGVAVHNGTIFVGSKKDRSVTAYDSSGNALYMLGSGVGEFGRPTDIAISSAGVIYVADHVDKVVRTYDLSGNFLSSFGDGVLRVPTGIAVDEAAGEIYIADNQVAYLWVYDLDGTYKRSISGGGWTKNMLSPQGLALDADNIYIVCTAASNIVVYTKTGTFLGYIGTHGSGLGELRTPLDVAFDGAGKLFVTNNNNERVEVFGTGAYTLLAIDPLSIGFSLFEGGGAVSATANLTSNTSTAWIANSPEAWASVSPASGTTPQTVDITVDPTGLLPGNYISDIGFTTTAGISSVLRVTLEVKPVPRVLSVAPSQINFTYTQGEQPYPLANLVLSSTGQPASWTASSSVPWLDPGSSSGTTPSTVIVSLNSGVDSLASGTYSGTITIDAGDAQGSPATVPVTLEVIAGGTIEVSTNLGEGAFTITGPLSYSGTGKSFTEAGVPVGTYTIEFGDVSGYITPDSYSLDLANGGTVSFSGVYTDIRASLNILASTGKTPGKDTNELNIYDGGGALVGSVALLDLVSDKYFWDNSIPASGDVDGDGVEELIISHDVGVITGLEADGTPMAGFDFMPFADRAYVDVSVADLDGDGVDEIVVSALNWSNNGAAVRVFGYSGSVLVDTGVNFLSYTGEDWTWSNNNDRRGTKVATGDIDGDGMAEILTVQGGGYSRHNVYARMFKVDTSGGPGNWSVTSVGEVRVSDIESYYSDIAAGDLDADGVDEIIISDAPASTELAQDVRVMAFRAAGDKLVDFTVNSIRGVEVAAGDLDFDGAAEIVVGEGAFQEGDSSRVRVFEADGTPVSDFMAFDANVLGVRISVGQPGN